MRKQAQNNKKEKAPKEVTQEKLMAKLSELPGMKKRKEEPVRRTLPPPEETVESMTLRLVKRLKPRNESFAKLESRDNCLRGGS